MTESHSEASWVAHDNSEKKVKSKPVYKGATDNILLMVTASSSCTQERHYF